MPRGKSRKRGQGLTGKVVTIFPGLVREDFMGRWYLSRPEVDE